MWRIAISQVYAKISSEEVKCFIVPKAHWRTAIDGCHQDAGHQGKKRMESLISDRFWWPGVHEDVDQAVQNCGRCQLHGGRKEKAPVVPVMVTALLQLVHLNFTLFEMTTNLNESPKVENVLVIVDHFTRFTRAYATKDQKALTAAKTLYKGFISIFGAPKRILTDQGKAFTSEVVGQLCSPFRISQSTTTAYHPQGNGQVEHAHQTLGRMIGKLEDEFKGQWPKHLSKLMHAYNLTRSAVTSYSPHFLMYQFVGERKLKDRWGDEVYTVCDQVDVDVPVYIIKNQRG